MGNEDPDPVTLSKLSWPDVKDAIENGTTTVIIPLGATEQHGPHLPLDTDTRLATEIAERVARHLGDALVGPTIPIGPSVEHTGFPGTISISPETLTNLLRDYVSSFESQGFERLVILPGHGGCFPAVSTLYPELAQDTDIDVVAVTELQRFMELLEEGLTAAGIDVDEPVVHGGASETAMILATNPDLVADNLPEGHTGTVSAAALFAEGIETYDEAGVLGDARPATADAGETLLNHVAAAHTAYIRDEFRELATHSTNGERG